MEKLAGKTAIISGGTTGIGRACAIALAQSGCKVIIFGRHQQTLTDALSEIQKIQSQSVGFIADVSKYIDVIHIFEETKKQFGEIDFLINNASVGARSIEDADYDEIDKTLSINIAGYLYCTKEALKAMKQNKGGHIINIGSLSSKTKDPDSDLYVATKSAIEGFTDSIRKKTIDNNIKITLISPGSVGTNMIDETSIKQRELQKKLMILKAEDIANCVIFALEQSDRVEIMSIDIKAQKQILD